MRAVCQSRMTWRDGLRPEMGPMLEYRVSARRIDAHGSVATTKDAEVVLDTDVSGRPDAFNPAELFLASIAACMIKGIERVTPMLKFDLRGVEVKLHGVRQDNPPKMISIDYELIVDTDETTSVLSSCIPTSANTARSRTPWLKQQSSKARSEEGNDLSMVGAG